MERTLRRRSRAGRSTSGSRPARARTGSGAALDALLDGGRRRLQDPRGLRRLPRADRRASCATRTPTTCRCALHTDGLHEIGRARGHRRRDRRPDRPRLSRRGHRRRPRAGPASASSASRTSSARRRRRPSRGASTRRPSTADDRPQPRRIVGDPRGHGARPRAHPPRDDGGRGTAPRARRDRDHQLRFAGDGPDRGDGPADDPAGPRDEGVAGVGGRRRGCPDSSRRPRPATTTSASCATSPSARSSRRSPTASPAHVGSLAPGRLADIVLWKPAYFGAKPELVLKARLPGVGAARRGQRLARTLRSRRATARTGAASPMRHR